MRNNTGDSGGDAGHAVLWRIHPQWRGAGLALLTGAILLAGCATGSNLPTETVDGLQLQTDSEFSAVYLRPDVDFTVYQKIGITPCHVSFKKNWMRDQNNDRLDLTDRVTQKDVDRIRDALAKMCDEQFRAALLEEPAYELVESFSEGESVLIVQPAIVNLDIAAPDLRSASSSYDFTTSSGEMTLALAALDGTTHQTLAEVADRRRDANDNTLQWTNSVTNRSAAIRVLKIWTSQLRAGLDRLTRHGS